MIDIGVDAHKRAHILIAVDEVGRKPGERTVRAAGQRRAGCERFPPEHHNRIRRSNSIERTFGETRRRVKVIGRFHGESSRVYLVWAVLDRAARGWRGFTMTSTVLRTLQALRRALLHQSHDPVLASTAKAA
ncbi:transposase [Nonomuraea sp. NPDC049152]|uniref:transposase n=1 Tax=Nonomuraea sp. NPDC049152 TaxID=3154350 RepID=UPI003407D66B